MKFGVHVNSGGAVVDAAVLRDFAVLAEESGCSAILIGDHLLPARNIETPFPLDLDAPPLHVYQEHDWPDCFTTLAFLAALTKRVRLGVSVIILPYRHPVAVTKMLTTLDRLSDGRVVCGVGVGWLKDEFDFLGIPFQDRGILSEDCLRVMKALWTNPCPRLETRYGVIDRDVNFGPRPIQHPHPPIWVGGNSMRALNRVARWGDGWQPVFLSPAEIEAKRETLATLLEKYERPNAQISISTLVSSDVSADEARQFRSAGVQELFMLTTTDKPDELFTQLRGFAETCKSLDAG